MILKQHQQPLLHQLTAGVLFVRAGYIHIGNRVLRVRLQTSEGRAENFPAEGSWYPDGFRTRDLRLESAGPGVPVTCRNACLPS